MYFEILMIMLEYLMRILALQNNCNLILNYLKLFDKTFFINF